jgi:hypothetical protein
LTLQIATFGSCLSRYSVDMFLTLFAGELVSCVFHNRSDAFIRNVIEQRSQLPEYEALLKHLRFGENFDFAKIVKHKIGLKLDRTESNATLEQHTTLQTLQNQYPAFMGLHNLPHGKRFEEVLKNEQLDLIVVDNYMDISPRLMALTQFPDHPFFVNHHKIANAKKALIPKVPPLTPEASVRNFTRILQYFRLYQPRAVIVFLQFPYNLYPSVKRHLRCQAFETLLTNVPLPAGVVVHPPFQIIPAHQRENPQHYLPVQYAFYAGLLYDALRQHRPDTLNDLALQK